MACLRGYGILDSPDVAEFDDFVRIAAEVCGAPISVVNLIDARRQWFAAEIGLGVRETPLDISICAHAILEQDVLVVPDLRLDGRFACNPLVTGPPGLRFYGGALLKSPEGLPLGTMCVLDYSPRPGGLSERQVFTLRALARQVMTQLELRRVVAEKGPAGAGGASPGEEQLADGAVAAGAAGADGASAGGAAASGQCGAGAGVRGDA